MIYNVYTVRQCESIYVCLCVFENAFENSETIPGGIHKKLATEFISGKGMGNRYLGNRNRKKSPLSPPSPPILLNFAIFGQKN